MLERMIFLGNKDIFEQKKIILFLDGAYNIRFTMKSVYILEDIYGSINAAFDNLRSENTEDTVVAVIDFLYALIAVPKVRIEKHLTVDKLLDALKKISEAIEFCFVKADENAQEVTDEPWDWDSLYYAARYHLKMSDSEFWDCSPRRFHKLNYLWMLDNGLIKTEPRKAFIDEIVF